MAASCNLDRRDDDLTLHQDKLWKPDLLGSTPAWVIEVAEPQRVYALPPEAERNLKPEPIGEPP